MTDDERIIRTFDGCAVGATLVMLAIIAVLGGGLMIWVLT